MGEARHWPETEEERAIYLDIATRCRSGEITTDQADEEAKVHGLAPFVGRPDPSIFDPMQAPSWTLLQSIAWIAYRDIDRVRDVSEEFLKHWRYWRHTEELFDAGFIVDRAGRPDIFSMMIKDQHELKAEGRDPNNPDNFHVVPAKDALWSHLIEGSIAATGFTGIPKKRANIAAHEWNELHIAPEDSDLIRGRYSAEYSQVCLLRKEIMSLYPPTSITRSTDEKGGQVTEVRLPKRRGPKTSYEWGKLKEQALNLLEYHGDFSADDSDWNAQARLEEKLLLYHQNNWHREPSLTQLRLYIATWLAEWRNGR